MRPLSKPSRAALRGETSRLEIADNNGIRASHASGAKPAKPGEAAKSKPPDSNAAEICMVVIFFKCAPRVVVKYLTGKSVAKIADFRLCGISKLLLCVGYFYFDNPPPGRRKHLEIQILNPD